MKINWQYTIGEILIVIIGITIAFSLDNWNATRKGKISKTNYLKDMVGDIEEEIAHLESNNVEFQKKLRQISGILKYQAMPSSRPDTVSSALFDVAKVVNFTPKNTACQTLINSGDFKLINQLELRQKIEEHYALHALILQDYERQFKIHEKYLGDFFIQQLDYSAMRNGHFGFLESNLLGNILQSLYGTYLIAIQGS